MSATSEPGAVAALAEVRKEAKYTSLCSTHVFTSVAIETSGVFGPKSLSFIRELGNSTDYLMQRLTVAVQRGNSAAVLGTMGTSASLYGPP